MGGEGPGRAVVDPPIEPAQDHGAWLAARWERVLDELAGELAGELAPVAGQPAALVAQVADARRRGWPDPVVGYWVAAARRAGVSWVDLAGALEVTAAVAAERYGSWADRFAGLVVVPRGNLPCPPTSFVGRSAERAEVARLLGGCRVLTLSGPAGVGKTRLALRVAAGIAPTYPGGSWWVDLTAVDEGVDVVEGVARALSVPDQPGRSAMQALSSRLGSQRNLLVLDNCEHLIPEVAGLVDALLRACPALSVLATSRQALGVAGEVVWIVPALPLPPERPPSSDQSVAALSDAVELFCRRAAEVVPGFTLTPGDTAAVGDICRRLDGLPLAIELAAARVGTIGLPQIAERLEDRLTLLGGGSTTGLGGSTTARIERGILAEALDWSHDLLSGPEQAVFRRLAVFVGGFPLAAAQTVCAGAPATPDEVPGLLASLVSKSLLQVDDGRAERRYRLLETCRAYARDRLDQAGEVACCNAMHARWCRDLARSAEPELTGPDQREWLDRLEGEYENCRSALTWLEREGDPDAQLELAGALSVFWRVHTRFAEGRRWLDAALASGRGTSAARAEAAWGAGFLATMLCDRPASVALLDHAMTLYDAEHDLRGRARCLMLLADAHTGTPSRSCALADQAVALSRSTDDPWCVAHALAVRGRAQARMGDAAGGRSSLEEAVAIARMAREPQSLRLAIMVLGGVTLVDGDYRRAEALLEEGLGLVRQLGDGYSEAMGLVQLGRLAIGRGEWDRAREFLAEGMGLAMESGNPQVIARAGCALGRLAQAGGDAPAANRHFADALAAAEASEMERAWATEGLGEVALGSGDTAGARLHFQAVASGLSNRATQPLVARAWYRLGQMALSDGSPDEAAALHRRALEIRALAGDRPGVPDSLEALASLAAGAGRLQHAARLFGAAGAVREANDYAHWPADVVAHRARVEALADRLGPARFEAARAAGAAMSVDQAVAAALGVRRASKLVTREAGLTASELQVAALAAQGMTNPEIGERLFISRSTARAHLSAAFAKLGVSSRQGLAAALDAKDI